MVSVYAKESGAWDWKQLNKDIEKKLVLIKQKEVANMV
jgi:hypothetical protein